MSLLDSYKASRVLETIENYSLIEKSSNTIKDANNNIRTFTQIYNDENFWIRVLNEPDIYWNKYFDLIGCSISFWVARVPGLFWANNSQITRDLSRYEVAYSGEGWKEYYPVGKSINVMGGVGTLLLPPNDNGYQLITLTFNNNASSGIPALISPNVLEGLNLEEGDTLEIENVKWRKMETSWSQRFPSIKGIPKGYFLIDDSSAIYVSSGKQKVEVHPYTIMEYEDKDALLYDFVYVTTDNFKKDTRGDLIRFFDYYKRKDGRHGRYLLSCDIANPIFEAEYESPSDLKDAYSRAQLEVLKERIRKAYFNNMTLDKLIKIVPSLYDTSPAIRTLAGMIGLPNALLPDNSAAKMSIQLISLCLERKKIEELIDRISIDFPNALRN